MEEKNQDYGKRWKKCWKIAPEIYQLLKESKNVKSAREAMMHYLSSTEMAYRNDYFDFSNADFVLYKHALIVLKNIFSRKYERISGASPLKYLWEASKKGESEVKDAFIAEISHLFRGLKGVAAVYPSTLTEGLVSPEFDKYQGRSAGIRRSDFLDQVGENMDTYTARYKSGLDEAVRKQRIQNRRRLLKTFDATEEKWQDYRWHFRNVITDIPRLEKLKKVIDLTKEEETAIRRAIEHGIPFGVTPHYLHLMSKGTDIDDYVVRRQVFPSLQYVDNMIRVKKGEKSNVFDYMREHDTSPVDHITRRYVKVCILKPYDTCPQICVYCQRNWEITSPFSEDARVSQKDLDRACDWLQEHSQIMDVLVTGGDPLVLSDARIDALLKRLSAIPHIRSIRIASRIPITVPQRITPGLVNILSRYHEDNRRIIYLVTHFEHAYEISDESVQALRLLRRAGINAYNQQVFTFANSRRFESVQLRVALKMIGVDPYYTFNMKGKGEMRDYSVPVARLLQERKEEARLLPGIYRSDEPVFNVPFLGKNHLRSWQDHELISIKPDGRRVYAFHPWEKNIRKVDSYIYEDVSIGDYLRRLEEMGEDPEDYKSIWYYY